MTALLIAAVLSGPHIGYVDPVPLQSVRVETAHERCDRTNGLLDCIHFAARRWKVSESLLRTIAWRESNYQTGICNSQGSGACGPFQFMPPLWSITPYARRSRFHPKWASLAAAWCFSRGYASHWATYG